MIANRGKVIYMVSSTIAPMMDDIHIKGTLLGGCGVDKII